MTSSGSLRHSARLLAHDSLSPSVALLRLELETPADFSWNPGQYLELSTGDGPLDTAPYSIASTQDRSHPGRFELAVSREGGQELLARVRHGATILVSNARGGFLWEPRSGATLLIGIGTGIAPLRAMLQACLRDSSCGPVALLFGARSEVDILWRAEFDALSGTQTRFHFEPTLSRPSTGWRGRRGRVQEHLGEILARLVDTSVYLCGTKPMVAECVQRLLELGLDPQRLRNEAH